MGDPTRQTAQGEHNSEHVRRNVQCTVNDARVEIDVWIQAALYEVFIVQCNLLQLLRDVQDRVIDAQLPQNFIRRLFDDPSPGVEVFVDTVPEAHQAEGVVFILRLVYPLLQVATVLANGFEHFDDGLVRTAVEWSPKCGDSSGYTAVQVGL